MYAANGITAEFQRGVREFTITADLDPLHSPDFDVPMAAALEGFRGLGASFSVTVPPGVPPDSQTYSFLFPLEF